MKFTSYLLGSIDLDALTLDDDNTDFARRTTDFRLTLPAVAVDLHYSTSSNSGSCGSTSNSTSSSSDTSSEASHMILILLITDTEIRIHHRAADSSM